MKKKIGIIGGGFCGIMTAVQIIQQAKIPVHIILLHNNFSTLLKGWTYQSWFAKQVLNVYTRRMSAFQDKPEHFLDWISAHETFKDVDRQLLANSFMSRALYGQYLSSVWNEALEMAKQKNISVEMIEKNIEEFVPERDSVKLISHSENLAITVDACVLATGNSVPANLPIKNASFYNSPNYFQNPWNEKSVIDANNNLPVLIIGNGLTMADTVIGLKENHFLNAIYSISPNGFNILPHLHNGLTYSKLTEELKPEMRLHELVSLINRHVKIAASLGISPEPVIDSLRPYNQKIWQQFTIAERKRFMNLLRHQWGVARHRIPVPVNDKLNKLKEEKKLFIISGKIMGLVENETGKITVHYFDKKLKEEKKLIVGRVINCTGPQTDFSKLPDNHLLKTALQSGFIFQDELKLGINTDVSTYKVMKSESESWNNVYTLGTNLKGMLWESTAVPELRLQAKEVAEQLLKSL